MKDHEKLHLVTIKLKDDYRPWGEVERWADPNKSYPDCSYGCIHARELGRELGYDWVVCV